MYRTHDITLPPQKNKERSTSYFYGIIECLLNTPFKI